jgi:dihydroflavonol-4-reductase
MRCLVTGATGFLGSHVARRLVARGDDVRVLVRATSDRSRLRRLDLEYVEGDVTDAASVVRAVEGVDLVFHCAAVVEFGPRDPSFLRAINVAGTRNVLDAAVAADATVVYVSSLAALGATPADEGLKDESWWSTEPMAAVYEETKREAHLYARSLIADGAKIRIALPGGIYGYGDQSTMYDLIRSFSLYPMLVGYMPEVRQSTVNVDDCADALLLIANEGTDGEEYIVVSEAVTIKEWLVLITAGAHRRAPLVYLPTRTVRSLGAPSGKVMGWLGKSPTMIPETIAVATHHSAFSGAKLRALGWDPRPLDVGMKQMAAQIRTEARERRRAKRSAISAKRPGAAAVPAQPAPIS